MIRKPPLIHRLFGTPQAPEAAHWAIEALAGLGAVTLLKAGSTLAIWHGAPPDTEAWFQLAAGIAALLAALGLWRARSWGRSFLLAWAVATAVFLVDGVSRHLEKHGPEPDRDLVIIAWALCAAFVIGIGLVVHWFWRRSPVREW
jgi:hypothetical protein